MSTYYADSRRQILWLLPRKNAGTSIRHAIGATAAMMCGPGVASEYTHYHTISVIRHPWDRLNSALHNPFDDERPFAQKVEEEILRPIRECWTWRTSGTNPEYRRPQDMDHHLWPQWATTDGFRVDQWLSFENLKADWMGLKVHYDYPNLEHLNRGEPHDWRTPDGQPFDWSPLMGLYGPDFDLYLEHA